MSMNEVVKKLSQAIDKQADKAKTTAYDTPATVRRIEGDTAWVHIPGGVDETPVKLTISAKEGDQVQVRVSGGSAFMVGNGTNPPTDDARANEAYAVAGDAIDSATMARTAALTAEASAASAQSAAASAQANAAIAKATTDEINNYADSVSKTVTQVLADGETAGAAAQAATEAADSALYGLSTVEDVVGVLNWITAHGTMTLTSDVTVNPAHVYFVVDAGGDYVVGGTHYSIVSEPKDAELSTYYELTVDESVQNYVATHVAVDSEGLWLIPEDNATIASSSKKILIAVGGVGHTYETAGTYIIEKVNGTDTIMAKFTADQAIIGQAGASHSEIDAAGQRFYSDDGVTELASFGTDMAQIGEPNAQRIELSSDGLSAYNGDSVKFFDVDYDGGSATETMTVSHLTKGSNKNITTTTAEILRNEYSLANLTGKTVSPSFVFYLGVRTDRATIVSASSSDTTHFDVEASLARGTVYVTTKSFNDIVVGTSSDVSYSTTVTVDARWNGSPRVVTLQIAYSYTSATQAGLITCNASVDTGLFNTTGVSFKQIYQYDVPTTAPAFTFGTDGGLTKGSWSIRAGQYLAAESSNQTAIGKFNANSASNAFEIGNGTADNARSNALTVDWSGNIEAAGGADLAAITESSGTYSGGLNDEALLTTATINKWKTILGIS